MERLLKCLNCKLYTLEQFCPACGLRTVSPRPPKFISEDKYGNYRREEKKKLWGEKGWY